jgi:hypothetical protein
MRGSRSLWGSSASALSIGVAAGASPTTVAAGERFITERDQSTFRFSRVLST